MIILPRSLIHFFCILYSAIDSLYCVFISLIILFSSDWFFLYFMSLCWCLPWVHPFFSPFQWTLLWPLHWIIYQVPCLTLFHLETFLVFHLILSFWIHYSESSFCLLFCLFLCIILYYIRKLCLLVLKEVAFCSRHAVVPRNTNPLLHIIRCSRFVPSVASISLPCCS